MKPLMPNIFTFATSELSQDAFICWLVSWANDKYHNCDEKLYQTACYFLDKLFETCNMQKPPKYKAIEITKQFKKIDVLIKVNDEYVIIIEDKVNTTDHSNQLKRYLDEVRKINILDENILPIYFKTGDQSDYGDIKKQKYFKFTRREFLDVLVYGKGLGVKNAIFIDYYNYLEMIEEEVNSYNTIPITEWKNCSRLWFGFFIELKKQLGEGGWNYVPNKSGGFMGFWWHWKEDKDSKKFLQLEEKKLCFKIEVENKTNRSVLRNIWSKSLLNCKKEFGLNIQKPLRFGKGKWMTTAILDDFRKTDKEGKLDISKTVALLHDVEKYMDFVLQKAY